MGMCESKKSSSQRGTQQFAKTMSNPMIPDIGQDQSLEFEVSILNFQARGIPTVF
jgi:hypothetical protein